MMWTGDNIYERFRSLSYRRDLAEAPASYRMHIWPFDTTGLTDWRAVELRVLGAGAPLEGPYPYCACCGLMREPERHRTFTLDRS